jgi:YVTN family beta-propeller protein
VFRKLVLVSLLTAVACRPAETRPNAATTGYLVLQKLAGSVAFYSHDGDLLATVPVGLYPHEMIMSADGRYAYVTDYGALGVEAEAEGGTTVSVIDVQALAQAGEIVLGEFRRPHGIDLDHDTGHLLVTTENPNRLIIIDPATHAIVADFTTQGRSSHMVTLSPDGKTAFVSNIGTQDVSVIDLETGTVLLIPVGERPEGSDITEDGTTLYVACRESNNITIIDVEQASVVGEVPTGAGPNRVRLTPDERFLIYSLVHDNQIGIAEVETGRQIATVDLDGSPASLQMSPNGKRILTASQGSGDVYVISIESREIITRFKTVDGAGPDPVLEITLHQPQEDL